MAETMKDEERVSLAREYVKARLGRKARKGESPIRIAHRLLRQQTLISRGQRSINQYLDDHADVMQKTVNQTKLPENKGGYVDHPLIKKYWWRAGTSQNDLLLALSDSVTFAEKDDPDHWIDSFKAALKMQPLEWYEKHHPQAMKFLLAAQRAEVKNG